jgi:glycosyltransferase involved in cell wall biosynthesis
VSILKKIIFFLESLAGGGAEKVLSDLVKKLDKSRYDITVVTVVNGGIYEDEVRNNCNYYSILPDPTKCNTLFEKLFYKMGYKLLYWVPTSWIYKCFINGKFDIEIGFIEGFATKVISNSMNKKSKKIAWVHVDPVNQAYADKYYRNIKHQKECYKRFDNIVCVSESVKRAFGKKMFKDKKLVVKYNPVDKEEIIKKSKENCEIKKPNKLLIGTVGRLTSQKGYDRLLRIVKSLKSDGINLELWILGEGEERPVLEKYIFDNNLQDSVKLLGFKENPYKYLTLCDLFVCSSRAEGFSLAIAEAITLELPVLSTDCAGPSELLGFGSYGLVVDNNETSLLNGIKSLVLDKSELAVFKKKSTERKKVFEIEVAIKEIEEIFI